MPETVKTDNSYLLDKVALRLHMTCGMETINVLDAFGGNGLIWKCVDRKSSAQVNRVAIDNRLDIDTPHLHGDNVKIISGMKIDDFNVIDLDAYGIPAELIKIVVVEKKFSGIVFVTCIQTSMGGMPKTIADEIGLPIGISNTCPSLVGRRGWEFFKIWLADLGITKIIHRSHGRKHYLGFVTGDHDQ